MNTTEGSCPVAEGTDQLSAMLEESGSLYPADLGESFPEVTIDSAAREEFHRLRHAADVSFKVDLATPPSGSTSCPLENEETESCTDGVTGTATVTLHRLVLYRSKRAYER